ncbi:hypothetical protein MHU86_9698 [Fragilaria crotonensis]|nr:hypothetical protein MHU86_9698 [Fragilaria crotonensis]
MVPLANRRCVDSDKSFSAAATAPDRRPVLCHGRQLAPRLVPVELRTGAAPCSCFNNCQNKRAPLPPPTTATLRCFFTSPGATATTEPTPAIESAPPAAVPTATGIPPALSPTSRQPSASTIDVDGDVGMTPEPLDRTPAPTPDDDNDDPSLPAPTDTETAADAGEDPIPACPPVTEAAANRANATAREDPEAAPGPAVTPDAGADLPGYFVTAADRLLDAAYGDHVHDNAGTHLHGDFSDDALWQRRWRKMAQIATTRYQAPAGRVGRRFIAILTSEFRGVRERRWNSERPLVFVATVLQTTQGVRRAKDIRSRLAQRMDLWDQGHYKALVDDDEGEVLSRQPSSRPPDEEARARSFNARVLSGRLRSAVRTLTNRSGGGVRQPDDLCTKSGRPVWQVLQEKHPALRDPTSVGEEDGAFEPYSDLPTPIPVCVTQDDVEAISPRLAGAAGPGGTDAVDLANWLLRFGRESEALREEMAAWTNWLANTSPPWAAYRAVMANRLVALDKQPGTRPVGIGEVYRRLWAKCLLKAIGSQATAACGNFNLCAGLQAGIEGAVHAVRDVFADPSLIPAPPPDSQDADAPLTQASEDPPAAPPPIPLADMTLDEAFAAIADDVGLSSAEASAVLLVDATNGFNELGRKAMLWTVRHRWANGARFSFNCYRHSAQLLLRRRGDDCEIILSREGVTQGDPLSMVLYGLALTPLATTIRARVPTIVQPWYADDAAMAGPVDGIAEAQRLLLELGPRRILPEPDKSILIVPLATPPTALESLAEFNFRTRKGTATWAASWDRAPPRRHGWTPGPAMDRGCPLPRGGGGTRRPPTLACRSHSIGWQYLQRVTPDIAPAFAPLEAAIATVFLPALLDASVEEVAKLRPLLALPTRLGGLGIPDPTTTGAFCYAASTASTNLLHCSLVEGAPLCAAAHRRDASTGRLAAKAHQRHATEGRLAAILDGSRPMEKRRIIRSAATGAWLSRPSLLNGSDLSAEEFRDGVRLRLGLTPTSLPPRCDGCGERFTTEHAMSCRKGGLILHRHNDLVATWGQLCGQAHTPSTVSDEPLIQTSQDAQAAGANRTEPTPELRGDIAVHGFWTRGTTAIFDVRVTDTDAPSNRHTAPAKVLRRHEAEKKAKYGALCIARRRTFTPLVFSVDGMQGVEATAASRRLASSLASKWRRSYSEVCGFVRSRLAIALVRSASRCLRADRNPMRRTPSPIWDCGAGLGLYRM